MINKLYAFRFELFYFSLLFILFGGIFFPIDWFENVLAPILFIANILSGILLISKRKVVFYLFIVVLIVAVLIWVKDILGLELGMQFNSLRLFTYFVFYSVVSLELIRQVWNAAVVNKNVIIGIMCGYISLGLVAFFIFMFIDFYNPNSFNGLNALDEAAKIDQLLYYSYITLLTIGYGEITPVTLVAQKAAILTGLAGQFYLVILTAIIVGKFINESNRKIKNK